MKKILSLALLLLLYGCSSVSSTIDADSQDIQYQYFEKQYNDAIFLSKIANKLEKNEMNDARAMFDAYIYQRRNFYRVYDKQVYHSLSDSYNDDISRSIKKFTEEYSDMIWDLHTLFQSNPSLNQENRQEISAQIKRINTNVLLNTSKSTNTTLSIMNIVQYPDKNMKAHGLNAISKFINDSLQEINEFKKILANI